MSIMLGNAKVAASPYLDALGKAGKVYSASNSLLGGGGMPPAGGGGMAGPPPPRPPMQPQLQSNMQILGGGQGAQQLPPELMFLPSSDPRVQQWYAQHPQQGPGSMYG
jgi:hypothetical protein